MSNLQIYKIDDFEILKIIATLLLYGYVLVQVGVFECYTTNTVRY